MSVLCLKIMSKLQSKLQDTFLECFDLCLETSRLWSPGIDGVAAQLMQVEIGAAGIDRSSNKEHSNIKIIRTSWYPWTIHHSSTRLTFLYYFLRVLGLSRPHWSSLCSLYLQNTGQFSERNVWVFWKIIAKWIFSIKNPVFTFLPGNYRNGVFVAVCNLAVFPWWVENSYSASRIIYKIFDLKSKINYAFTMFIIYSYPSTATLSSTKNLI